MSREDRLPGSAPSVFDDMYPYRGRFESYSTLPPTGRDRAEILHELRQIARGEDARWETGRISGSYYHGGKEHYAFLNEIFGLFSHVNLLQRDMCPSGTKFEAEVVSMTANMGGIPDVKRAVEAGGLGPVRLGLHTRAHRGECPGARALEDAERVR